MESLNHQLLKKYKGQLFTPEGAMALAIELSQYGVGFVEPNPPVGCVILNIEGELIGLGYHMSYGGPHAEVEAVNSLSHLEELTGATIYVTLEPCAHQGKTPSCAKMLANHKIKEVVYGLKDPNPKVNGEGHSILEAAGIMVNGYSEEGALFGDLRLSCKFFLKNIEQKKPYITLKVASSLDGQMALKSGESQWMTNDLARVEAHRLRAHHDGVLCGVNTFLSDNPRMNIRHPDFVNKKNKVVIIDPNGRGHMALAGSALLKVREPELVIYIANRLNEKKVSGVNYLEVESLGPGQLNMNNMLIELYKLGVHSLYVEGGSYVFGEFLNQKEADQLALFFGNKIIGSKNGISWLSHFGIEKLSQSLNLTNSLIRRYGDDYLLVGQIQYGSSD